MIQDLRSEIQAHNTPQLNQESTPPLSSVTDNSSESSISALQSEVATLKDFINNMQQSYQLPQPPPQYFSQQMPWTQQSAMPISPYQAYANQASAYPIQQDLARQHYESTNNNRRRKMYYCWTHGACYHPGHKCRNKATGHQDNATFQNRMGGSIKNVRGIPQQSTPPQRQNT